MEFLSSKSYPQDKQLVAVVQVLQGYTQGIHLTPLEYNPELAVSQSIVKQLVGEVQFTHGGTHLIHIYKSMFS